MLRFVFGQQAVAGGPRATDRFAAVTAAFVSGLAGTTRAAEVTAFFLEAAAARMEAAIKVRHNVMYGLCWRSSSIWDLLCLQNQALLCNGVRPPGGCSQSHGGCHQGGSQHHMCWSINALLRGLAAAVTLR